MQHSLPLIFDSDLLPAGQRLPFARDVFGSKVLQVKMENAGERPFRVRFSADVFGATRIATISSTPMSNIRDRKMVANNDGGIGFVIPLHGRYIAGHQGNFHSLMPGQVMALSNGTAGMVSCPAGGTFLTILAPRESLLPLAKQGGVRCGERLHYSGEGLDLLHAYLRFFVKSAIGTNGESRALVGQHIIELLLLALTAQDNLANRMGSDGLMAARLASVQAEIDRNFSEPWFGVESCAARLGLSTRYVQRLCQRNGTSFVAEIRRRRLDKARRLLLEPASRNTHITDIALDCGYSDISHFNRLFRAAFGDSPSGVRNSRAGG